MKIRALLLVPSIITLIIVSAVIWMVWAEANRQPPFCGIGVVDSTFVPMRVGNLTRASDIILIGPTVEVGPSWESDVGTIVTRVIIEPSEVLKGAQTSRPNVSIVAAGGTIGCYTESWSGEPSFSEGEQVLLFLIAGPSGLRVSGGIHGKYAITDGMAYSPPTGEISLQDLKDEIGQNL